MKKILFLIPYPLATAPSQRFRFEQYFELLKRSGFEIAVSSFLSQRGYQVFYQAGHTGEKAVHLFSGYARRLFNVLQSVGYSFIFIHREATPLGPPWVEWLLARMLGKKIIYDFDDAIWLTDHVSEGPFVRALKWRIKVKQICRWAHRVSCGNHYLRQYALVHNANAIYNPTTIDFGRIDGPRKLSHKQKDSIAIGWTGSHSTLKYLESFVPVLQQLEARYPQVRFVVIANRPAQLPLSRIEFIRWSAEKEIENLRQIDIGIMPLPDDEWTRGKCAFKALQYMALEIPAVASAVGANLQALEHGVSGFLCNTNQEWVMHLSALIEDAALRKKIGHAGRQKVQARYSVSSNAENFLSLFTADAINVSATMKKGMSGIL